LVVRSSGSVTDRSSPCICSRVFVCGIMGWFLGGLTLELWSAVYV
jgi:hypothetical protein